MQDFTICTGNSRQAAKWPTSSVTFDSLCKRLEVPIKTSETVAEYRKMSRKEKAEAKDHGGFVAAEIDGLARKKEKVTSRTMITLDVDKVQSRGLYDSQPHPGCSEVQSSHSARKEDNA